MSIAEPAIGKRTLAWTLSLAVLCLGWLSFEDLPRRADPEISIKEVQVVTPYPGASAAQVEREVTDRIERAARELGRVRRMESFSSRGLSVVNLQVRGEYDEQALPHVRNELRHQINDLQPQLPPGAGPSIFDDDFGLSYGFYYALVGEGFTPAELERVATLLQRELGRLAGIKKVILLGEQQEIVSVEISRTKTEISGIGRDQIIEALRSKNLPADAGRIRVGPEHVPIDPDEIFRSEKDLGDLLIAAGGDRLIRLGDLAEIRRGYEDPPRRLLRIDGRPAVGIAVSTLAGGDPIAAGKAMESRLAELTARIPLGMELKVIALQSDAVEKTIGDFTGYLVQSLTLLIAALLLFMGLRSGLIVAFVTLVTLAGTFLIMDWLRIPLERISLGALVLAAGLIPGNAVWVVDGMRRHMDRGMASVAAAREVAARNALPLLGATAAAVLAFAPVAGMDNSSGDYAGALFPVILIGLTISWLTAATLAPLLAGRFLATRAKAGERGDLFGDRFHPLYARILEVAIHHRWAVLGGTALLFALSLYGLGVVEQIHFSSSSRPGFQVEAYFRAGTHIRETEKRMDEIHAYLHDQEGITQVATAVGAGHPRLPFYNPGPDIGGHYGASLVRVDDQQRIDEIEHRIQADLEVRFPDALINVEKEVRIPNGAGGGIQLRISGPDPAELRRMTDRAKALITADPDAKAVRDDWGAKVKVARPLLAHERARRLGIDRPRIAAALHATYPGTRTGFFREGTELIPIVVRAPREERGRVEDIEDVQVTSPLRGDRVSLQQLVERLDTITEDARRSRRDGLPTITVHAEARQGPTFELFERLKPLLEKALEADRAAYFERNTKSNFRIGFDSAPIIQDDQIPLKGRPGYSIGWGGEPESLAQSRARLWSRIPLYWGLTALILVALFNNLRRTLIVLLAAPLATIGAAAGLLLTGLPFDFLSLLGLIGLSGLLIRITIPIVDRIDREIRTSKGREAIILRGASSCLRPAGILTGTGILAVLPLLQDGLFRAMAVTLISGLGLATLLTLVVTPVLYRVLFGVR